MYYYQGTSEYKSLSFENTSLQTTIITTEVLNLINACAIKFITVNKTGHVINETELKAVKKTLSQYRIF